MHELNLVFTDKKITSKYMRRSYSQCLTMCMLFSEEPSHPEHTQNSGEIDLGEVQQVVITGM
jgi:hypothetical protein